MTLLEKIWMLTGMALRKAPSRSAQEIGLDLPSSIVLLPSGKRVHFFQGTESVVEDLDVFMKKLHKALKHQLINTEEMSTILNLIKQ